MGDGAGQVEGREAGWGCDMSTLGWCEQAGVSDLARGVQIAVRGPGSAGRQRMS